MINSKRLIHLSVTDKTPIIKQQIGFTPIILVIVITLLRILSTVAVPRFIDLSEEAHRSAVSGTAGSFAIGLMLIRSDAVMQLCSYAVMQLCSYAVMQLCKISYHTHLC
jgi:Tfp pilus assembly protein FimT